MCNSRLAGFCMQDHIFTLMRTEDGVETSVPLTTTSVQQFQTKVVFSSRHEGITDRIHALTCKIINVPTPTLLKAMHFSEQLPTSRQLGIVRDGRRGLDG